MLRRLVHRIQIDDLQKYHLPISGNALSNLASEMGFPTGDDLTSSLFEIMGKINRIYHEVFRVNEVNDIVGTIATAIEEQSTTTKEIAGNVSQASRGINEVNENVAQSSRVANDIASEINEVTQAAGEMSNNSSQIQSS